MHRFFLCVAVVLLTLASAVALAGPKRGVIVRNDGGISLLPWKTDADAAETFSRWQESARPEWLPATLESTEQTISDDEFGFHGSQAADNALEWDGAKIVVNMPAARSVHAGRVAVAQAAEIARLKVEERAERLKSNTAKANAHAATITALEALDLNVLATQIGAAPNATALSAIWPVNVPR